MTEQREVGLGNSNSPPASKRGLSDVVAELVVRRSGHVGERTLLSQGADVRIGVGGEDGVGGSRGLGGILTWFMVWLEYPCS